MRDKILAFLKDQNDFVPTLQVSKAVVGKSGTCKMVNPVLYALLKENLVSKITESNGSKPRWKYVKKKNIPDEDSLDEKSSDED